MNKKFKIILALTLIVQLLIPVGMLYHHATIRNFALNHSLEYKFKLLDIDFWDYDYMDEDADSYSGTINLEVGGVRNFYNRKIAVTIGEDGFVDLAELENRMQTNCWSDYDYCQKNCTLREEDYSYEPGVDIAKLKKEINETYGWTRNFHENGCYAYVTAKVYKGVFIPTAIYIEDEKVITIHTEN